MTELGPAVPEPDAGAALAGKRLLILGLGVAGNAAVEAAREIGAQTVTVDANPASGADAADVAGLDLASFDAVMASPAFAPHSEPVRAVLDAGLPVWSEMELAWRVRTTDAPWVLIT